ncbi:type II secretion system F family protein [Marisediminicola sp. LYQ85]|uniref:type II secretion system F family protein n=1 Tax=Marisediminicola sp. LYQ85 TaxID=3391062 RepID=UPI0039833F0D
MTTPIVALALGLALGLGALLAASPFLWPRRERAASAPSRLVRVVRDRLTAGGLHSVGIPAFVVVSLVVGLAVGTVVFAVAPVVPLGTAAALSAALVPWLVVSVRARQRRVANRTVWPDHVDHLVSAVRSGLALPDSVSTLARTGPAESRAAFGVFESSYRTTGNFATSVDEVKARLADPVADRVLETLRMSREVGGSELTTVLRSLASYLRQEAAIRAEVEARQSWVVNAARLGVAAPWIVLGLLATRPEAAMAYNTPPGAAIIIGGLAVSIVAYRIMVAIGRLPEERRWFA